MFEADLKVIWEMSVVGVAVMAIDHALALPRGFELEGYRIEGILGVGGFGITYRALEIAIDRIVAIKEYLPSSIATRNMDQATVRPISGDDREGYDYGLKSFQDEAKTLVRFDHPNIVRVHRYFSANSTSYLVMQYVDGDSLHAVLNRAKTLPESEILEFMQPILSGLEQVHDAGFLHRDIKPANIYIRTDGSPMLLDFGAARLALGAKSMSLTAIVSGGYAPMEQYTTRGKQGPWTDIYGLGATLYRAITGERPPEAMDRIEDDDMASASEAGKGRFGESLLQAVDRSLTMSAKDRPQSVAAFRELLREAEVASGTRPIREEASLTEDQGKTVKPQAEPAADHGATVMPQEVPAPKTATDARSKLRSPLVWWTIAPLIVVFLLGIGAWQAAVYKESGQHRRVIQDSTQAIRLNPKDAIAYFNRGDAYLDLKQYRRAIQDYDAAIRLNPRFATAYNNRGVAYDGLKQHRRAIQNYNAAIRLNPKDAVSYSNRAWSYEALGRRQEAIRDFRRALKLDPSLKGAREGLKRLGVKK